MLATMSLRGVAARKSLKLCFRWYKEFFLCVAPTFWNCDAHIRSLVRTVEGFLNMFFLQ